MYLRTVYISPPSLLVTSLKVVSWMKRLALRTSNVATFLDFKSNRTIFLCWIWKKKIAPSADSYRCRCEKRPRPLQTGRASKLTPPRYRIVWPVIVSYFLFSTCAGCNRDSLKNLFSTRSNNNRRDHFGYYKSPPLPFKVNVTNPQSGSSRSN